MEAREEEDIEGRPGDTHSRKIYGRCESAGLGVVFAEWQVIGVGGKVLSPNAPAGVEGCKSKSKLVVGFYVALDTRRVLRAILHPYIKVFSSVL